MSRRKHNISYIKPDEPKFLREIKEKVGYKEGPTIETKRAVLPEYSDDDEDTERNDEKPVVVVVNSGDLTAEEADAIEKQKQQEEANAPADLSKRVIFRKSKVSKSEEDSKDVRPSKRAKESKKPKAVLSFNDDEDEGHEDIR